MNAGRWLVKAALTAVASAAVVAVTVWQWEWLSGWAVAEWRWLTQFF